MKQADRQNPTLIWYPVCSTCKKAKGWLEAHDVDFELRSIVDVPPTVKELTAWISVSGLGVRKWLNTSGLSYRALGKAKIDAASDAELVRWLSQDPKLIKRPVLVTAKAIKVGFREPEYAALFE